MNYVLPLVSRAGWLNMTPHWHEGFAIWGSLLEAFFAASSFACEVGGLRGRIRDVLLLPQFPAALEELDFLLWARELLVEPVQDSELAGDERAEVADVVRAAERALVMHVLEGDVWQGVDLKALQAEVGHR